jgi:phosphatidylserine decarboxylase
MPIAKEGNSLLLFFGFITLLLIVVSVWKPGPVVIGFSFISALLFVGIIYFFRDPERFSPDKPNIIVAPADGTILAVTPVEESEYLGGKAIQVSIFLSVLDVHVNRAPISGKVELCRYQPGSFFPAFSEKASRNEQTVIGITNGPLKIIVRQVAGILARRIVCHLKPGMAIEIGKRFGMIKFGSRTDLIVPLQVAIHVQPKQHVKAGETIIGTY